MVDAVIIAQALCKRFPLATGSLLRLWLGRASRSKSFTALDNVSLRVPKGEMLGVLGHNGAGKSTLLRVLAGIYSPDSGHLSVCGSLAGLFELGGLGNNHLTGRVYVERYLALYGVKKSHRAAIIDEIHMFCELGGYFDEKIRTYSAGMTARLYFSTITAIARDIYLVDEILSVGDEHFQVKSWSRMRERLAGGASGILVTHDWSAVIKLCRSACVLSAGRIVREGASDAVVADYLRLPAPESSRAEIIAPEWFTCHTNDMVGLTFDVVLHDDVEAEIALSIEYLMLGVGWEIIALSDYNAVGQHAGRYRVHITLPELALRAGEYVVNLFLAHMVDGKREALHGFSWTYGNGIPLRVDGVAGEDIAPFPIHWMEAV